MRSKRMVLALMLALMLACPILSAQAAPPVALTNGEIMATLDGAQEFALYYPGGEALLQVTLAAWPPSPLASCALSLRVRGANGFEGEGVPADGCWDQLEFSYRHFAPTLLTVQIRNVSSIAADYRLTASGIAPAPKAIPGGTMGASGIHRGGAAQLYSVDCAGDGRPLTISMALLSVDSCTSFWGHDPLIAAAVGFAVYGPSGEWVAESQLTAVSEERAATFSPTAAGRYTVQVYNALRGLPVAYSLQAFGG